VAVARLGSITLDCDDPATLAAFWSELLGGEVTYSSEKFVTVKTTHGWLTAIRVPDHRAPSWPGGTVPKQIHLDLAVDDLDVAETEAVRLGARRATEQPAPTRCRVLFDPAGHPFCLCIPSMSLLDPGGR
jgi:Glyoxalase-like domain